MPSDRKARQEPREKQSTPSSRQAGSRAKQQPQRAAPRHRGHGPFGMDSEQSARLLLFGVTAAVVIAAAAFIAIGYYVSVIQPRGRTVLQVDDHKVSYSAMKRRVAHEYYTNSTYQTPQAVQIVPSVAYANLVDELVLISRGETELGSPIDEAALDQQTRTAIGVGPDADEATFAERYRSALAASRLHDDEFQRKIRAAAISLKAQEKIAAEVPASVPQARVEIIMTNDVAVAQQALDRVRAGEEWRAVATELSIESGAGTTGGLHEYDFEDALPEAYRTFAFSAANGDISEPLQDPSGTGPYYVVRLLDRSDQPVTEQQKPDYLSQRYAQWLEDTKAKAIIVDKWTTDADAQASASEPILEHAIRLFVLQQELSRTPQPTFDPAVLQTAQAANTAAVQTQVSNVQTQGAGGGTPGPGSPAAGTPAAGTPAATSGAGTPAQTAPSGDATPVPTGASNGQ
jgi:hypothetical protein